MQPPETIAAMARSCATLSALVAYAGLFAALQCCGCSAAMPPALAGPPPSRSAFSAVPVRLRGGGNEGRMADEGGDQDVPQTDSAKATACIIAAKKGDATKVGHCVSSSLHCTFARADAHTLIPPRPTPLFAL